MSWYNNMRKQVKETMYVHEHLPLLDILDDMRTITLRDGYSVAQVLALDGVDYTGMAQNDFLGYQNIRESFLRNLPDHIKVNVFYMRQKEGLSEPEQSFGSKYAEEINTKHISSFKETYRTYLYMVVTLTDNSLLTKAGIASSDYGEESNKLRGKANELDSHVQDIKAVLEKYGPRVLHHDEHDNEMLSLWSYLVNGSNENLSIPHQGSNLYDILSGSDLHFTTKKDKKWRKHIKKLLSRIPERDEETKKSIGELTSVVRDIEDKGSRPYVRFTDAMGDRYAGFLFVKYYPHEVNEGLLEDILSVEHRFNVNMYLHNVNDQQKVNEYSMKHDRNVNFGRLYFRKAQEYEEVAQRVNAGDFTIVEFAMNLCVYGETIEEVDEGINKLIAVVARHHVNLTRETLNTEAAFWSVFPSYDEFLDPRKIELSSIAAAAFTSLGTKQQGLNKCSFGSMPVTYFKQVSGGQNYAFTFHPTPDDGAAGHTLVVGGTGAGKSVTMAHLVASCLKYQGRTSQEGPLSAVIFDSLNGLKVPVNALGGTYVDFANEQIPLNPMKMEDSAANRRFLRDWIAMISRSKSDYDYDVINRLIKTNYDHIAPEDRSLYALINTMGVAKTDSETGDANFAKRMREWLPSTDDPSYSDYPHGLTFNASEDALDFTNRLIGFDMTHVLKDEQLIAPLTSYIFHKFMQFTSNNPCPHLVFMDEALNFVSNDYFYPFIQQALLEFRKRNGVFAAAVQDVGYLYETKHGEDFIRSFPTYIIFPNPSATEQYYMGDANKSGLGLTKSEFEWIKRTDRKRAFMLKRRDGQSVILNSDLSHLGSHLNLMRGDKSVLSQFDRITQMSDEDIYKYGYEDWQQMLMDSVDK